MSLPPTVPPIPSLPPEVKKASERFFLASKALSHDRSLWAPRMFASLNLFLWHLDGFKQDGDPIPLFIKEFNK